MKFRPLVRKLPTAPLDQLRPQETPGPQKTDDRLGKVRKKPISHQKRLVFWKLKKKGNLRREFCIFRLGLLPGQFPSVGAPRCCGLGQNLNIFFLTLVCLAGCVHHLSRNLICKLVLVVTTNLEGWRDLFWLGNLLPAESPHPPLPGQESKWYDILDWLLVKYSLSPSWCKSVQHI